MIHSSYRMGWLVVMFDLPTDTKKERRLASRFRNDLRDNGYLMLQYSVYARCAVTFDKKAGLVAELKRISPGIGNIHCLFITDAQWQQSVTLSMDKSKAKHRLSKNDEMENQLQFW